jgi:biopolymer transport protein ExbB
MSDAVTYLIVKGTLALLAFFSAVTWTVVIAKGLQQWRISRQNQSFAEHFPDIKRLPTAEGLSKEAGPTARVALAGVDAWDGSLETVGSDAANLEVRSDILERGLRQQIQRERRGIEAGLAILASIGSTSPFVGLFGTVLGIIHALARISALGSASLDVVAGPIGEALVATGIGIAVAVPAVLAYNFFVRRLKSLAADLEDFSNTFVSSAIANAFRSDRPSEQSLERPISVRREASA